MKRGWSILLGELVDATDVGHGDAADFQVVCEICREPVFKTERRDSHFLSHYPAAARWAAECELRVARSIREDDERTLPSVDRGQSLKHYLSVFEDMTTSLFGPTTKMPHIRKAIRSDSWNPIRLKAMEQFRRSVSSGDFENLIGLMLLHKGEQNSPMRAFVNTFEARFPSILQQKVQRDTAIDMARAICSAPAARNLSLLMGMGYLASGPDLRRSGETGRRAYQMFVANKKKAMATMRELERVKATNGLLTAIIMHSVQIVAMIDYVGFLPNADGSTPKATSVGYQWEWNEKTLNQAHGLESPKESTAPLAVVWKSHD